MDATNGTSYGRRMCAEIFSHSRFGDFVRTNASTRQAWQGRLGALTLYLDTPSAIRALERLPAALEPWINTATKVVAADLVQHGNKLWLNLGVADLAGSLRLVALGALEEGAKLTLAFEEGAPVRCDVSAEFDPSGKLLFAGYTNRAVESGPSYAGEEVALPGIGSVTLVREFDGHAFYVRFQEGVPICFELKTELSIVVALLDAFSAQRDEARARAAASLCELWNDEWREDGAPRSSAAELAKCFQLSEVYIYEDGEIEYSFDDGDAFAGHNVSIRFDGEHWDDADIAG